MDPRDMEFGIENRGRRRSRPGREWEGDYGSSGSRAGYHHEQFEAEEDRMREFDPMTDREAGLSDISEASRRWSAPMETQARRFGGGPAMEGRWAEGGRGSGYQDTSPYQHRGGMEPYGRYSSLQEGGESPRGVRGRHFGRGPKGYQRSAQRIEEDVCEMLTANPEVDASEIEVSVEEGGVVVLRGSVDDRDSKRNAELCIENLPGVRDVRNELRIGRAAETRPRGGSSRAQH